MDERPIFFVGDIQGCARELALLLERADFQPGQHRLLPVGDTVNRGPDSPGVLRLLREAQAEPILGNHELALMQLDPERLPAWATRPSSAYVQLQGVGMWEDALATFSTWPLWREGADWVAVHAGLHPVLPPDQMDATYLTELRWNNAKGERPPVEHKASSENPPGYLPWFEHYQGDRTVLFGHWAQRGLVCTPRVRGLDTGCVYGKQLTGLWWPEDRLVQVEALDVYARIPPVSTGKTGS